MPLRHWDEEITHYHTYIGCDHDDCGISTRIDHGREELEGYEHEALIDGLGWQRGYRAKMFCPIHAKLYIQNSDDLKSSGQKE